MSVGLASGAQATRIVCARSAAEIPVVTPLAASIETVKLVPCTERFTGVIGARSSCRARSSVIGMHTSPLPNRAMKLTISGVTTSAATTRSPSFSRSSSSTRITMRPALISAMISGIALIARDTAGEGAADGSIACRRVGFTIAAKVVTGTLIILRRHAAATGWRQHRGH